MATDSTRQARRASVPWRTVRKWRYQTEADRPAVKSSHGYKLQADHKLCMGDQLGYLEILRTTVLTWRGSRARWPCTAVLHCLFECRSNCQSKCHTRKTRVSDFCGSSVRGGFTFESWLLSRYPETVVPQPLQKPSNYVDAPHGAPILGSATAARLLPAKLPNRT
jgi:hypothetical protein